MTKKTLGPGKHWVPEAQSAAIALCASVAWSGASAAGPALPVPCVPGTCGPTGPSQFVTAGSATAVAAQNALRINQATNSAILNWSSFNIGAGASVTFQQPSSSSIALNKIYQESPSQILGQLNANGQVYLLNSNGFLFGSTATVNVGSLLVASLPLNLSDANFGKGILSPLQTDGSPVFDATQDPLVTGGRKFVVDAQGSPVLDSQGKQIPVQIVVQPGAQIAAANQGRVLLAGQDVTNGGSLSAPDGQVILAAGARVYLQADADPSLRGLVVEVDQGGKAWNQLSGALSAPRGNITMVGLAVNQDGRISATTSVSANGSIRLEAADTAFVAGDATRQVVSTHGGTLTVGPQSEMSIVPELASRETEVQAVGQIQSSVTLLGEQVFLQGGSITAPGGNLTAIAAASPFSAAKDPKNGVGADPNARLRIGSGVSVDLSGSQASLPATANLVVAQLRSAELADDPTQRDGPLHAQTVYVDSRNPPSKNLANLKGSIDSVPLNVAQRTPHGGHAVFQSGGDIVFANGATVNVSGGSTSYAGGVMQTSYLVGANGKLYPIATANPLLSYVGVLNPTFSQTFNKWGVKDILPTPGLSTYQPGYVQGAPAGSVQFAASSMVLQGSLAGNAVNGLYQRTPSTAVSGGQLTIGLPGGVGATGSTPPIDFLSPAIRLTRTSLPIVTSDDSSLPNPLTLDLPLSYLTSSGFTATEIYSNFDVTLPAGPVVNLPSGSSLAVTGARVNVLASITDPGGSLSFQNVVNVGSASAGSGRPGVLVGGGVTLDTSGLWTNDLPLVGAGVSATAQTWQNGGKISLGVAAPGALLSIGNDVSLHANGGAWLNAKGRLADGTGGSIALTDNAVDGGLDVGDRLSIRAFGVQGATGGTFNLAAPRVKVTNGNGVWTTAQQVDDTLAPGGVFQLYSSLFSDYGFQKFNINASGLVAPGSADSKLLSIDPDTAINATVSTLYLQPGISLKPSATAIDGIASVALLPPYLRQAASLSFNALPPVTAAPPAHLGATVAGDMAIGRGASITTDSGGSISLTSLDSILVDGTLRAPGGTIAMQIVSPAANQNAYGSFEAGFLRNQRIDLGPTGIVDVSGTFVSRPSMLPMDLGTLSAGGTVSLLADRGAVVAERGSLISVAGTTAPLDVLQANHTYGHEIASSAGGSIVAHSGESIFLLGDLNGAAGSTGTSGAAAAGSLEVTLSRSEPWWGITTQEATSTFNQAPLNVEILPQQSVVVGVPTPLFSSNQLLLGAADLSKWGFDGVRIESGNTVTMSGSFSLALNRSLVIDSPVLATTSGAQASLSAPYLEVGYQIQGNTAPNTNIASAGTGSVHLSGSEIDLVGTTVFQGASDVAFASSGDLLLRGVSSGASLPAGGITVAGNITLDAARIYPATATTFAIDAEKSAPGLASTVTVGQTHPNSGAPLSAGGALTIVADAISTTGTIYAPFGTISLNAHNSLTLGDGSFTSVSGSGLSIPYGETQLGGQKWVYGDQGPTVGAVPSRAVNLMAPAVTITKQATIDLSGGGDLSAFEWVPGSGGTQDALASGVTQGLYAILPSTLGQAAPQDPQSFGGSSILAGQSVYLSGGSGLAGGIYPLLPARYALVPGAYLIQIQPDMQSTVAGSLGTLSDGTPVLAGFLTYGQTGLHQSPGYTGFALYPGTYGGKLAQYDLRNASTYFSSAASLAGNPRPTLPSDAGLLSIAVSASLDVAGQVRTAAATGGLAAPVQISANDLVVGSASGPVPSDAVSVQASVVTGWHPGSILLGGTTSADGKTINVQANSVTIGSGTTLTADEIVLVAAQSIDVQNGATLQTNSAASGVAPAAPPKEKTISLSATGAGGAGIVALSDLNWLIPSGQVSSSAATVAVDAGASIASRGSLSFDAPAGVAINGTLTGTGAEWSLGSSSIGFVPAGTQADALSIGSGLLAQLETAGAVRLASTGTIDLLTPVTLGVDGNSNATLASLTISAAGLNNQAAAGAGTTQLGARKLTLEGANSNKSVGSAGAAGTNLSLVADELDIGPNNLAVNGFAATRAAVSGAVIGKGTGALSVGGDFSIDAAGVTAATGAQTDIDATGALAIGPANASSAKLPLQLGGALALSGGTVDISGSVSAPSGIVKITSGGALNVDAGANIDTAGRIVSVGNQSMGTPGGIISINSGGDSILSNGANLDASGAATGAGGKVSLSAAGSVAFAASVNGKGGSGAAGGSFSLDAGSLSPAVAAVNPMSSLTASIGSGGFNHAIDLRVRTGDVSLESGSALSANEVTLVADTGNLSIGGQIAVNSGALRGSMALFGGKGVELKAGGALHADGAGASGLGGTIEIGTGQLVADQNGSLNAYNGASIRLDNDSTITTAGAADNGTLLLRAPALLASNGVAIQPIGANTSGVGRIVIEPVIPFNTTGFSSSIAPSAADLQQVHDTVASYMAAAAPGFANLLPAGSMTPLFAEAGVELIAAGALTLQSANPPSPALDLSSWRFTGAHNDLTPVDFTVRAAGDINVANTLTDGFADATIGTTLQPTLLTGASSSIRLVSGADLSSANPLAALAGIGTLTIGPNTVVRTGTGDLDLVAGHNIVIGGPGAGAYTAGTPAIAPGGNDSNPYPNMPSQLGIAQPTGIVIPKTDMLMSFPTGGGNLLVRAGDDILGAVLPSDRQSNTPPGVSAWQIREGNSTYAPSGQPAQQTLPTWGVNLAAYDWNFGTLGGGDVNIAAGRDALNVTAAAADSLLPQYGGGTKYVTSGGLSFTAGRDIGSAELFLADGRGSVTAGGALTGVLPVTASDGTVTNVGSAFFLQASSLDVRSRLGIAVDGVFNPTTLGQLSLAKALSGSYLSYDDNSSLSLQALSGDIILGQSDASAGTLLGLGILNARSDIKGVLPPSLAVQALGGNIDFGAGIGDNGTIVMAPSPHGQLDLLAARNVQSITGLVDLTRVTMSDAVSGSYASVGSPNGQTAVKGAAFTGNIHSSDLTPALVTAGGNIEALVLSIPKAAQVTAGKDIVNLTYTGQNLSPTDQTVLMAGRDFVYTQAYEGRNGTSVGGPGQVDVLAGRNVSLGLSLGGVTTTGNLLNPNLPTPRGSDLTIATGLGSNPDLAGFLASVIAPSASYQAQLVNYVESIQGSTGLSFASAEAAFQGLTPQQQRPLIDKVFFNELLLSGRAANTVPGAGFKQGYAAIDTLFPGSRAGSAGAVAGSYAGDLTLSFSRIYTLSGGNIDLVVPGGSIDVGLANPPSSLSGRAPSSLGIVAEGPGDVNIYSRGSVNVNASRIFTLGGGNILAWSDEGSIDAGRGAKTAVSAPPPSVLINTDGTVTLDFSGAAAGSGIRTIQTNPKQALGSVDLIAPLGTIDAGDAGIGAAGNINLASRAVVGLDNIQFGGTSAGVPSEVSNLGASLAAASSAGSSAANTATSSSEAAQRADQNAAAPLAQTALSWLDVFVTGLGEDNCRTDDLECLKRQKTTVN